jgi:hypothetical protein
MVSPETACIYMFCHVLLSPSVGQPSKMKMYTALQNENGISCLTIIANKIQLTMPYGGKNRKQHSLHAGILKNCNE